MDVDDMRALAFGVAASSSLQILDLRGASHSTGVAPISTMMQVVSWGRPARPHSQRAWWLARRSPCSTLRVRGRTVPRDTYMRERADR